MRTLIHISDLHFGRNKPALERALQKIVAARAPDLLIVSGDLTQRAKISEFKEAQKFLASLNVPLFVIPGNHDVPFHVIWERVSNPYKRYKEYINKDIAPAYIDSELAIIGINSVRPSRIKGGSVSKEQLENMKKLFSSQEKGMVKIVVSHHPFNVPISHPGKPLRRAKAALEEFTKAGVDLLLAGHLHDDMGKHIDTPFKIEHKGPLIIQAGTAISRRLRSVPNSFNIIEIDYPRLTVERYVSRAPESFTQEEKDEFIYEQNEWKKKKL